MPQLNGRPATNNVKYFLIQYARSIMATMKLARTNFYKILLQGSQDPPCLLYLVVPRTFQNEDNSQDTFVLCIPGILKTVIGSTPMVPTMLEIASVGTTFW